LLFGRVIAQLVAFGFREDAEEALAHLHGTYGLLTEQVNLHGTLQLENKLSRGSQGIKSVLLKSVEPFLKKKSAGEIVPIKIAGTFSHPSYGLDVVP
jgi:hypothetical protein